MASLPGRRLRIEQRPGISPLGMIPGYSAFGHSFGIGWGREGVRVAEKSPLASRMEWDRGQRSATPGGEGSISFPEPCEGANPLSFPARDCAPVGHG